MSIIQGGDRLSVFGGQRILIFLLRRRPLEDILSIFKWIAV
jgi:hypothetical protein